MIFFEGVPLAFDERQALLSVLHLFIPFILWIYAFRFLISLAFIRPLKTQELLFKGIIILSALFLMYGKPDTLLGFSSGQNDLFTRITTYIMILILLVRHVSPVFFAGRRSPMNPMRLFVVSFLFLIALGTGLLMLPEATTRSITFTDALFTSTSAVCVTGLVVLDTSADFTLFGQLVIMFLIQFGALGIMTFTSFFVILARGEGSIHSRMALKDLVNHTQFGKIINIIYGILFMTFFFELCGAVFIYFTTSDIFSSRSEHVFFSVFHSVSAFCNAGFSNISGGFTHPELSGNFLFLLPISFLIILGGLGFFVIAKGFQGFRISFLFPRFKKTKNPQYQPGVFHEINFRLVVRTTLFLLAGGTVLFYLLEYNGLHSGMSEGEKWMSSFFSSVTARTAGFNTLDYSQLRLPAVLLFVGLMWIGGSPGSTAGGIKTTTFALAAKNFSALILNKKHVTIGYKRISDETLKKVSAILFSSVLVIMCGVFLLSIFEPDIPLHKLLFEYVSALGTVGLSMDVTSLLSVPSRYIIIFTMFLGRLGLISILLAFVRKRKQPDYYCPETTIFIN
jgi:trk system potassium uptake protein